MWEERNGEMGGGNARDRERGVNKEEEEEDGEV